MVPVQTSGQAIASLVCGLVSFCIPFLAAIPGFIMGIVSLRTIAQSGGQLRGKGMAIGGIAASMLSTIVWLSVVCIGILTTGLEKTRDAAKRVESINNMQQMGIALINYHDTNGGFPVADKNGLSWRVQFLPALEEGHLYDQFKHNEPWDSPHNIKLLPLMPKIYRSPRFAAEGDGMTYYRALVGPGTVFGTPGGANLAAIANANGTGNTIMIVEAGEAVPWTKPDELFIDPTKPLPPLGGPKRMPFLALFADGHVQTIRQDVNPDVLRMMIDWRNQKAFVPPQ